MVEVFFWLLVGHAMADYPLQGDFLARGKNRHSVPTYIPPGQTRQAIWPWCLGAHAFIHGGAVALATGSVLLGVLETLVHWSIDFGKCENWYGIHVDQGLHVATKVVWVAFIVAGVV